MWPVSGLSRHGSFHRLPFEFSSIGRIRILVELGLGEIKTAGFEDLFYHQRPPRCPIKASLTLFLITCINQTTNALCPSGNRNAAAATVEPGHQPRSPGWEHLKGGTLSYLPSIKYRRYSNCQNGIILLNFRVFHQKKFCLK